MANDHPSSNTPTVDRQLPKTYLGCYISISHVTDVLPVNHGLFSSIAIEALCQSLAFQVIAALYAVLIVN